MRSHESHVISEYKGLHYHQVLFGGKSSPSEFIHMYSGPFGGKPTLIVFMYGRQGGPLLCVQSPHDLSLGPHQSNS